MGDLMAAFLSYRVRVSPGPHHTAPWLAHVHNRIGTDSSLDLSMRSLACLFNGLGNVDERITNAGRALYVKALRALQTDLSRGRSSQSNIQSTAMLLTFYEVCVPRAVMTLCGQLTITS